jgi:hypothetical protein
MPSRSTKEQREKDFGPMGTGLLEGARRSLGGRRRKIDEALEEAEGVVKPKPKKQKQ